MPWRWLSQECDRQVNTLEITMRKPSPVSCPQHLIQWTPIQMIVDTPSLREGSGKGAQALTQCSTTRSCTQDTDTLSEKWQKHTQAKQKFLIISNFLTSLIARLQPQKLRVSLPRNWLKHQGSHLAELPLMLLPKMSASAVNLHHREAPPLHLC